MYILYVYMYICMYICMYTAWYYYNITGYGIQQVEEAKLNNCTIYILKIL